MKIDGILLIYYAPASTDAQAVTDHVASFKAFSDFEVWPVNVLWGFPRALETLEFALVVLHYSIFGRSPFLISEKFSEFLLKRKSDRTVAFFQDEHQFCRERFAVVNKLGVGIIYSLLEKQYFNRVYGEHTNAQWILPSLTGYVPNDIEELTRKFGQEFHQRKIDVGYRARTLPYFMGKGAREKVEIALGFVDLANQKGLQIDISIEESDRIYGDDWYEFIGNCKFMLGVESGASIFDLDGEAKRLCESYLERHPDASFDEVHRAVLAEKEGNINYRAISPRVFEMAALGTVPLMFYGSYNGLLQADVNYIGIEKDFSNIDDVFNKMEDVGLCMEIIENNRILLTREELTYVGFIKSFDEDMRELFRLVPATVCPNDYAEISRSLAPSLSIRRVLLLIRILDFPGRNLLKNISRLVAAVYAIWVRQLRGGISKLRGIFFEEQS